MNRSALQTLAGCGIALAVGVFAGWLRPHFTEHASSSADARPPIPDAAPRRPIDDDFSKAMRTETGAQRWLTLLSAAEHASAADMPGLVRAAEHDPAILRTLAARWAALDPKHMLNTLYADALLPFGSADRMTGAEILRDVLLEEWTKHDLAGAITALNDVPAFSMRDHFRRTLANAALKSDVERGLRLMGDWKLANYEADLGLIRAWAARDPRHAAEVALPSSGFASEGPTVLKEIGKAWAETNPVEGLKFAAGLGPEARARLGSGIIGSWAARDLSAALAYLDAQPEAMRTLAPEVAAAWGKSDPASAIAWSEQNLKGTARNETIAKLVTAAAEKDLAAAGELVAAMKPGAAQDRATTAIFETWLKKEGSDRNAAFEWLASVPDAEARRAALERVGWTWAMGDPAGARDFLGGPHGDMAPPSMVQLVVKFQAAANPDETMAWAGTLPAGRRESVRNAALEGWMEARPEGATAFVRALPSGAERTRAIETISRTLALRSAEQAVGWLRDLPAADQKLARDTFARTRLPDELRRQLDAALKER